MSVSLTCCMLVAIAPGSAPPASPQSEGRKESGSTRPATQGTETRTDLPTAEDLLRALQRERPLNEVIPPASAKGGDWPKAKRKLLPEGSTIVGRSGVVVPDGEEWRFRFDGSSGEPAYRLLPNALLEVLIHALDESGERVHFMIAGEITTFRDENLLILRSAARRASPRAQASSSPPPSAPRADADPVDVLKVLRDREPAQAMVSQVSPAGGDSGPRRDRRSRTLVADGTPLVDRPGRVLREGASWVFVPDSDRPEGPEPTFRLLPNQRTESVAKALDAAPDEPIFIVSGEITQFQGENYLLPRSVLRQRLSDNLRK